MRGVTSWGSQQSVSTHSMASHAETDPDGGTQRPETWVLVPAIDLEESPSDLRDLPDGGLDHGGDGPPRVEAQEIDSGSGREGGPATASHQAIVDLWPPGVERRDALLF